MTRIGLGALLGLGIGIIDVLLMLPLSFPDKRAAHISRAPMSSRHGLTHRTETAICLPPWT